MDDTEFLEGESDEVESDTTPQIPNDIDISINTGQVQSNTPSEDLSPREQRNVNRMQELEQDENLKNILREEEIDDEKVLIIDRFKWGRIRKDFQRDYRRPYAVPLSTFVREKYSMLMFSKKGLVIIASNNFRDLLWGGKYKDVYRDLVRDSEENILHQKRVDPSFKGTHWQMIVKGGRATHVPDGLDCSELEKELPALYKDLKSLQPSNKLWQE